MASCCLVTIVQCRKFLPRLPDTGVRQAHVLDLSFTRWQAGAEATLNPNMSTVHLFLRFQFLAPSMGSTAPGITLSGAERWSSSSGCGSGLRGSIWSRMAVLYTKIASTVAACARSAGCKRS